MRASNWSGPKARSATSDGAKVIASGSSRPGRRMSSDRTTANASA